MTLDRSIWLVPPAYCSSEGDRSSEGEEGVAIEERQRTKKPRQYKVVMHNDDYTTQVFVIDVLQRVFLYSRTQATQLMLLVHKTGMGVVGIYSKEVAEAKIAKTTEMARASGYPLKLTMEPE